MLDLQELPRLADSLTYLYAEHCIVEQKAKAIELFDKQGATLVPTAALTVLLLGPGTRITHAAVKVLAESGCSIVWVGEDGTRCYANGGGETRKAYQLLHQARLVSDERARLEVCKQMYRLRFGDQELNPDLTIQQLRGMEGARMRDTYAHASITYQADWHGRSYKRGSWGNTDPVNRALSAANALLNGICHAAIISGGYSPALGFIHTGKQLSFVYDIADLYKTEITIPTAFRIAGESAEQVEPRVRQACRQAFKDAKLLRRILPDINKLLNVSPETLLAASEADTDPARPEPLWDPSPTLPETLAGEAVATVSAARSALRCESSNETPQKSQMSKIPRETRNGEAQNIAAPLPPSSEAPANLARQQEKVEHALRLRRQRASVGLEHDWIVRSVSADTWNVITRPGSAGYIIQQQESGWSCSCPDFAKNDWGACKHTFAVELVLAHN